MTRHISRDANREYCRRYYQWHRDELCAKRRERYARWAETASDEERERVADAKKTAYMRAAALREFEGKDGS